MSATMARQGGQEQLEQSFIGLAWNMAKMAKGRILCGTMEETQQQIEKSCTNVQDESKQVVEIPGHYQVKAAMKRHVAMVCENQMDGGQNGQNGTAMNPDTGWRREGTGTPPPELAPPPPGTPHAPPGHSQGTQSYKIDGVPPRYVYIHTPLPNSQLFNLDTYAKDRTCDKDFISHLLTDVGPSTG